MLGKADRQTVVDLVRQWWQNIGSNVIHDCGSMTNDEVKDFSGDRCYDDIPAFRMLTPSEQEEVLNLAFPPMNGKWSM